MNEILKMLNGLRADELDSVIMRAIIMLEKKRKEEAEQALLEKERLRQEKIAQEKRRQEEIAELQRKLRELQNQSVNIPDEEVQGDNFVMRDPASAKKEAPHPAENARPAPKAASERPAPAQPAQPAPAQSVSMVSCPHCHQMNAAGSAFCANCGQRMTSARPKTTPQPAPTPAAQPQQPQTSAAQVWYADASTKEWVLLPGEETKRNCHEIVLLQPNGGKFAYYMEVTNRRILFSRENSKAKGVTLAARMGGGLVGSMIAEGIKSATGTGPKPWLEIPLTAVQNCGFQNKKEFFIEAGQTYVLKNKSYEKLLPQLVWNAKMGGA